MSRNEHAHGDCNWDLTSDNWHVTHTATDSFYPFWKCLWTVRSLKYFLSFFFSSFLPSFLLSFPYPLLLFKWNTVQIFCCLNIGSHASNFIKDVKRYFILNSAVLPSVISSSVQNTSKCDSRIHWCVCMWGHNQM